MGATVLFPGVLEWGCSGGMVMPLTRKRVIRSHEAGPHRHCFPHHSLVLLPTVPLYSLLMSIRKAGGEWEPMLLGVEPRQCKVCKQGLYRDTTLFRGGWSRCTVCDEFVHYSCLASGKVSFLKARPRICKDCRAAQDGTSSPSSSEKRGVPTAVGS